MTRRSSRRRARRQQDAETLSWRHNARSDAQGARNHPSAMSQPWRTRSEVTYGAGSPSTDSLNQTMAGPWNPDISSSSASWPMQQSGTVMLPPSSGRPVELSQPFGPGQRQHFHSSDIFPSSAPSLPTPLYPQAQHPFWEQPYHSRASSSCSSRNLSSSSSSSSSSGSTISNNHEHNDLDRMLEAETDTSSRLSQGPTATQIDLGLLPSARRTRAPRRGRSNKASAALDSSRHWSFSRRRHQPRPSHARHPSQSPRPEFEAQQIRLFGGEPGDDPDLCFRMLEYFGGLDYLR